MDAPIFMMQEHGWREAMAGALSFYDANGQRLHSLYLGEPPEYGKDTFKQRYAKAIQRKALSGYCRRCEDNWSFLTPHTTRQLLDFYHVTGYLGKVSYAVFSQKTAKPKRVQWLSDWCYQLKHEAGTAEKII
jgi:hypothetical protein